MAYEVLKHVVIVLLQIISIILDYGTKKTHFEPPPPSTPSLSLPPSCSCSCQQPLPPPASPPSTGECNVGQPSLASIHKCALIKLDSCVDILNEMVYVGINNNGTKEAHCALLELSTTTTSVLVASARAKLLHIDKLTPVALELISECNGSTADCADHQQCPT